MPSPEERYSLGASTTLGVRSKRTLLGVRGVRGLVTSAGEAMREERPKEGVREGGSEVWSVRPLGRRSRGSLSSWECRVSRRCEDSSVGAAAGAPSLACAIVVRYLCILRRERGVGWFGRGGDPVWRAYAV